MYIRACVAHSPLARFWHDHMCAQVWACGYVFRDLALLRSLRFGCMFFRFERTLCTVNFSCMWAHSPARAHMCAQGARMFFSAARSPLRSAAHFNPSGLAFGLLKIKCLFFREILKNLLQNGKISEISQKSTFGQALTHATLARAQHDVHVCKHAHRHATCACVDKAKGFNLKLLLSKGLPAFSRFYEKQPKIVRKGLKNFRLSIKWQVFVKIIEKFVANSQNSGISLENENVVEVHTNRWF